MPLADATARQNRPSLMARPAIRHSWRRVPLPHRAMTAAALTAYFTRDRQTPATPPGTVPCRSPLTAVCDTAR